MTSERKRKRGPTDVDSLGNSTPIKKPQFSTPKVERQVPNASQEQPKKQATIVKDNEEDTNGIIPAESPKNKLVKITGEQDEQIKQTRQQKKAAKAARKETAAIKDRHVTHKPQWKLSEPAGGRMLNIDPIFVGNEK